MRQNQPSIFNVLSPQRSFFFWQLKRAMVTDKSRRAPTGVSVGEDTRLY
jgi:hypothetical protein